MVLYVVKWFHDSLLSKGKGRATKTEDYLVVTVLCDNRTSALRCFEYWFEREFLRSSRNKHGYTIDDGQLELKRSIIDSRGFNAHYFLTREMKEPINLIDVGSNVLRASKIFGS